MTKGDRKPRPVCNPTRTCLDCGGRTGDTRSPRCLSCSKRGAANPQWRGDDATVQSGRDRAQQLYAVGVCELCDAPGIDRHHKDSDTHNNAPTNIQILCRRCHMAVDGRADVLRARAAGSRKPPAPCVNCGRLASHRRHGRCGACRAYFDRHGVERQGEMRKRRAA